MTDVSEIPESSFPLLEGLDILLLDCLREKSHPTHINIEQSISYIGRIKAKQSYLIHMTHELEYASLSKKLPKDVFVGFDGLKLSVN
jgi:phosphoribosyl 1,2-cyclic phosphate phosphodiesterase